MWLRVLTVALLLASPVLADEKNIDFDAETDFAKFKTFSIRNGQITTQKPELRGPLVQSRIEAALRAQLKAKGLTETQNGGDLIVNYRLGAGDRREVQRVPAGRRGRLTRLDTYTYTEGTLLVDLTAAEPRGLVWRGVYRDDESNAGKLSDKLPDDIKKLFEDYPPKK
jgi:hypothetical protein